MIDRADIRERHSEHNPAYVTPISAAPPGVGYWAKPIRPYFDRGSARQFTSEHVHEALQTMVELMRSGKREKVRLSAAASQTSVGQWHDDLAVRFPNPGVCCMLAITGRLQKESNL